RQDRNACQQASVQAVVLAVQPARQVLQLAVSQALTGTATATRTPRSPMEVTSRRARVLTAHVPSIPPPTGVAVLRAQCSQCRSGQLSAARFGKGWCKRRAVVWDLDSFLAAIATAGRSVGFAIVHRAEAPARVVGACVISPTG